MSFDRMGFRAWTDWSEFLRTLRQCVRNDPFELCWECSSEVMGRSRAPATRSSVLRGICGGVFHVLRLAFKARGKAEPWERQIAGKIFFFVKTDNQAHAVQPIVELLGREAVKSDSAFLDRVLRRAALLSLPFLPVLVVRCLAASAYQRRTLPRCVSDYWLSYGFFLAACLLLQNRPAVLVVSNDHTTLPRTMTRAASFKGVPTAFVPHAGVIEGLPPLCFDIAFLDGLATARKYGGFGPSRTKIYLAGNCRLDHVLREPVSGKGAILFCPGFEEDEAATLHVVEAVVSVFPPERVVIRPHPREPARQKYLDATQDFGCQFSDARWERAEVALSGTDIVVSGDSNMILEAKLARRWVAVFAPFRKPSDRYGYIAEGVPNAVCRDCTELIQFLQTAQAADPPIWADARKYMSTAGTRWEGRSAELIATSLRQLARADGDPATASWEAIEESIQQPVFVPRPA